jgi:MFS family permease
MSEAPSASAPAWPSRRAAWTAAGLLALGNFFAFVDRQVISLLIEPIKADFDLSDTQAALLLGLAFGLFYTLLSIPIGRLVDGWSRKTVAAIGMTVWSFAAIACGAAQSFVQLFVARMGVGAGEASLNPAAYSMLADYFPKEKLSTAIGVYTMAAFIGAAASLIGGGFLLQALGAHGPILLPVLGEVAPWQLTFIILAAPGLIVALLVLLIREPPRRGVGAQDKPATFREALAHMGQGPRQAAFVFLIGAFTVHTLGSYAGSGWTAPFFIRTFGWEPAQVGLLYGLSFLIFGAGGAFAGGWYGDRLRQKGMMDAQVRAAMIGILLSWPMGTLSTLVNDAYLALALTAGAMFFSTFVYPLAASAIQVITPNRMRGQASAVYLTAVNLVGLGLGPLLVGMMNDFGFTSPEGVRYSLAVINAITPPLMAGLLFLGLKPFAAAVKEAQA